MTVHDYEHEHEHEHDQELDAGSVPLPVLPIDAQRGQRADHLIGGARGQQECHAFAFGAFQGFGGGALALGHDHGGQAQQAGHRNHVDVRLQRHPDVAGAGPAHHATEQVRGITALDRPFQPAGARGHLQRQRLLNLIECRHAVSRLSPPSTGAATAAGGL